MDKRAAMPNLDASLLLTKQSTDTQFSQGHFFDSRCGGRKLPFRPSKLACGLSVCLMAQAFMATAAHAIEPTKPEGLTKDSQSYDPNLGRSQIQSQDELEEALIALKLKRAVEQGMIDPSVLEDYQRETLNSPVPRPGAQSQVDRVASSQETPNREANESSEAIFDRVFSDRRLHTNEDAGNRLANAPVMQSPQQIEQALSQITPQVSRDFNKPVARLDATEPPLGFDTALDASAQINPSNKETLGIIDEGVTEEQLEGTKPVYEAKDVTVNPDSEQAKSAENAAHQAVKNTAIGKVDNKVKNTDTEITDNVVAEAQQNGAADSGINPDDYLPEYQEDPNNDLTATVIEEQYQDEDDSKAKPGFIKGLYNRFFNDGYAALPRIKAKIYLQQSPATAGSEPKLVKVDKGTQPATNIKAAMENITVESISDFTAVTPKLHQEALNAAQAVGYYDIKLSFKRVDSDEIAVIIERLGDPVRINTSPIIDIRGGGEDLPEFKAIQEDSPLKEGEIFNHGEYKQTKQRIETTRDQFGFFDGQWLNKSVDIILPDNTADVDLVYDTGERYHFDKVVFFTVDKETGQLTTDPDKLPVKAELLHQLHRFEVGDDFYAPDVTRFTNDLSATRYFNSVNVETIRPNTTGATLGFENDDEEDILTNGDEAQLNGQANGQNSDAIQFDENGKPLDTKAMTNPAWEDEFAPIEYTVDQETSAKLENITTKAERLSRLPDDRVLDESEEKAKSLLGKISNAVSDVVKQVFPDERDPYSDTSALPDDLSKTVLANRKTPQEVAESKSVPLYVFVTADRPRDVDLGIGYGTDTGVRAVARMEHNLINRDGYQAGISVGASKINKSVNLHASRPWKHPLDDTLNANISYEQETINQGEGTLDLETNTIKGGVTRNIRNEGGWNRTYSVRYRQDQLESGVTGPDRENLPVPFNREGAQFNQEAFLLGYQIDKTVTDNVTNPTKGWHQYYSVEAGTDSVLSDTDMAIARAGVSGVYSFGEQNKHQVVASLDGGYIWAKDFEDVPYKLRFFAGGDRSIRGYDYNSLSATEKGYLVGGQVLAVGSTEYNYEFKPGLRGAVFADVGNAYDTNFEADTKLGLGFGVRWASPVGMVRVDLAAGVLEDSIPVRLHFFIGSPLQ
ncbi:autotransporter assembly complex protein TamA [Psychrobacter sp. UBA3962]|uniref:autotransporter assembly complex protein TamA n=1 Tax=Psychrobacter sp. UBA3962 TaxID=1947352 RepID=UPI0025D39B6C|nr:BamA/TamA family outer membrane protein [Psychrobacter sp. UBA3962]